MTADIPVQSAPADTHGQLWVQRVAELCAGGTDLPLDDDTYVWLVWAHVQRRAGHLSPAQREALAKLGAPLRELAEGPWERRFRQIALRDIAGLTLTGQWRTQWLTRQRRAHAAGELEPGRVQLMNRLRGFDWSPGDMQWLTTFAKVKHFADTHGRMPSRSDDVRMSNWLATQRFALRSDRLRYDRAQALSTLPGWTGAMSSTRARQSWERRCEQLRLFVERTRRYPRTDSGDPAEVALARWVTAQREQVRRDGLAPYRIAALSSLPGWRWAARDAAWDERYAQLRTELARGVPIGPDHSLYTWVVAQRRRHRDGRLRPEQARALHELHLLGPRLAPAA